MSKKSEEGSIAEVDLVNTAGKNKIVQVMLSFPALSNLTYILHL